MSQYTVVEWTDGVVRMLDQRRLPHQVIYVETRSYHEVAEAIRNMTIRGAPSIGVAAAYGMALAAVYSPAADGTALRADLEQAAEVLRAARPTAANLFYAVERVLGRVSQSASNEPDELRRLALDESAAFADENRWINRQIGLNALELVPDPAVFIHHCNTGPLATVEYGSALGIIHSAHQHGKKVFVYVDETRPRLQGARLTTWELQQMGVSHAVIVDGASGYIMKTRQVDLVTVGCDRVAANGDTANKIGTYNLAIVARAHGVPFYVAAPTSTIDLSIPTGDQINIEERDGSEVTQLGGEQITPTGTQVINPAFDVTPAEYITAIVTEAGIAYPPYTRSLPEMVARSRQQIQAQSSNPGRTHS
jgi:methylthioribose-1-phosphate isomerase